MNTIKMTIGSAVEITAAYDDVEKVNGVTSSIPTRLLSPVFIIDDKPFTYQTNQYVRLAVPNSCITVDVPTRYIKHSKIKVWEKE